MDNWQAVKTKNNTMNLRRLVDFQKDASSCSGRSEHWCVQEVAVYGVC